MRHEIHDGAGSPVRRCDRCGARLVSSSRCPSHEPRGLQERLDTMRAAHAPLTNRILEALRSLGPVRMERLCDLAICSTGEAATALSRLAWRGLAHRVTPGTWAPGRPATGEALVIRSPALARLALAQLRARRAA